MPKHPLPPSRFILLLSLILSAPQLYAIDLMAIGTGNVTGNYYPTVGAICQLVNKYRDKSNFYCSAEPTDGSIENLTRVQKGELSFGIVQTDVLYHSHQGVGAFEFKEPYQDARAVMALNPEILALVVKQTSNINVLQDIKGKRISIGDAGSGTRATTDILLEAADIKNTDLQIMDMSSRNAPKALADNKIDGYFYMVGHPSDNLKEAAFLSNIQLLFLDGKPIYDMLEKYPYYGQTTIPHHFYRGLEEDTPSIGVRALLITDANTSSKMVKLVLRAVLQNFHKFQKLYPSHEQLKKEDLVQDLVIPLHPAAEAYYRALGLYKP